MDRSLNILSAINTNLIYIWDFVLLYFVECHINIHTAEVLYILHEYVCINYACT